MTQNGMLLKVNVSSLVSKVSCNGEVYSLRSLEDLTVICGRSVVFSRRKSDHHNKAGILVNISTSTFIIFNRLFML